ncbi:MAG: succinyl-diaminopimelate desuccinylase [Proteobacteria bacterium]|nr:succinyl-diaminopimelate desuccinylase [Pseudomonadota bacterium]
MSAVVALTEELIRRRSVTPDDAGCQDLIAQRLAKAGFVCTRLDFGVVKNLWATHGGSGAPGNDPVLVFLGHTDVVPPGPREAWASDPFVPVVRDGMLYGRGAADMKSGVAAMVCALEAFVAAHPHHAGTVGLLLTSDEEGDAIDGVRRVAAHFRDTGQRIDWCVTGEPSSMQRLGDLIRVGRRGTLSGTLTVRGVQGHVAYPERARNPIHQALPALAELAARKWDDGFALDTNHPFPPSSLQISNIHAGTGANNVIPGACEVVFNFRYNPHWQAEQLERATHAILDAHGLEYDLRWHRGGEPFLTADGRLRQVVREVLREHCGGVPEESTGGGTSDARFIAPLGAEVIEFGPINASIHKIDEHVCIADLERLPGIFQAMMERLLATSAAG